MPEAQNQYRRAATELGRIKLADRCHQGMPSSPPPNFGWTAGGGGSNVETMKPLFTIHAGEYLVGSHIEKCYPKWNVWVPSKDTGIDLLVTDARNSKAVSLQVKYSKDFTQDPLQQSKFMGMGWWTHQEKKIKESKADFWVFVLPSFFEHRTSFIIVPPAELLRRFQAIHSKSEKKIQSFFLVTKSGRCWEWRGLNKADHDMIAFDRFNHSSRDFTQFLNLSGWDEIKKRL